MKRVNKTKRKETTPETEFSAEVARANYLRVMKALNRSANRVDKAIDGADHPELMVLERNLTIHHRLLNNVANIQKGLTVGTAESSANELDFGAARSELLERISRLRQSSGN